MKEIKILPSKMILKNGDEKLLIEASSKEKHMILKNLSNKISGYFSSNPESLDDFTTIIK